MIEIGDRIEMTVKVDKETSYTDHFIVSYDVGNEVISCGHCVPKNAKIKNGKILYTSGFDEKDEAIELSVIELRGINVKTEYTLAKSLRHINKMAKLIHNRRKYSVTIVKLLECNLFRNEIKGNILYSIGDLYFFHGITKLCGNNGHVGLYISNAKQRKITPLEKENMVTHGFSSNESGIINYVTEGSWSGSPLVCGKKVVGYHIGSTFCFRVKKDHVVWMGMLGYFRIVF